jgi:hypothetical protein
MKRLLVDEKERVGAWVAKKVDQRAPWGAFNAFGAERDGSIVAGVVVNNINGANATLHIASEKTAGKGLVAVLIATADYCFNQVGLKRMTGMVPMSMPDVIKFDKHLGWKEEFVMKDAAPDGGDMMVLVMRPDDCRWLIRSEKNVR